MFSAQDPDQAEVSLFVLWVWGSGGTSCVALIPEHVGFTGVTRRDMSPRALECESQGKSLRVGRCVCTKRSRDR